MLLKINRDQVLQDLLAQECTQGTKTITIDDHGKKSFTVQGDNGETFEVKGSYYLANLLQEIWLGNGELNTDNVQMKPLQRIDYLMNTHYWNVLSRRMNAETCLPIYLTKNAAASNRICMCLLPIRLVWRITAALPRLTATLP